MLLLHSTQSPSSSIEYKQEHYVCDSHEFWDDESPEMWQCIECQSTSCNVGIGFALYEDKQDIRWVYIGYRCVRCRVLGCFAGWKVGYSPSMQLLGNAQPMISRGLIERYETQPHLLGI